MDIKIREKTYTSDPEALALVKTDRQWEAIPIIDVLTSPGFNYDGDEILNVTILIKDVPKKRTDMGFWQLLADLSYFLSKHYREVGTGVPPIFNVFTEHDMEMLSTKA